MFLCYAPLVVLLGFLARSVLFSVGKRGEQEAVSSIKIYIWFAVYTQSPQIIILALFVLRKMNSSHVWQH
jgi:hypothetical protein